MDSKMPCSSAWASAARRVEPRPGYDRRDREARDRSLGQQARGTQLQGIWRPRAVVRCAGERGHIWGAAIRISQGRDRFEELTFSKLLSFSPRQEGQVVTSSTRRIEASRRGERRVAAAAVRPSELEWRQGFGRMLSDLLRRYADENESDQCDRASWYNRPWSDADRIVARKIDIYSF